VRAPRAGSPASSGLPDSVAPRPPIGAAVSAAARAVPDRPLRVARTLTGGASLRRAMGGKTVMVAGPATEVVEAAVRRIGHARAALVRLEADLSDTAALQTATEDALVRHGAVDALVVAPFAHGDEWQAMRSGYYGAVLLILAVLPGMLTQGRGQVVVLRSRGRLDAPAAGARGALDGFLGCAAPELTGRGITLTTVNIHPKRTEPGSAARAVAIALTHRSKRVDAG
jgi:short-subunit dehydrogenase